MCPTPIGRVHTRVTTILLGPALLGLIITLITGHLDWIVLVGVYLLMGTVLDTVVYPLVLKYQPPWMTFVLAIVEYGLLLAITQLLEGFPNISVLEATIFYWACWALAAIIKVVVLPIISLTYIESAGEFRRVEWSLPPEQVALPVLASAAEARRGPGKLLTEVSGVRAQPLKPLPAPSGVRRAPTADPTGAQR